MLSQARADAILEQMELLQSELAGHVSPSTIDSLSDLIDSIEHDLEQSANNTNPFA